MAFSQEEILQSRAQKDFSDLIEWAFRPDSWSRARNSGYQTAFLCFSHEDKELALALEHYLDDLGWNLYIHIRDTEEQRDVVDGETAEDIQEAICSTDLFLFLATESSTKRSRWCPWEIGYADAKKRQSIIVVETYDGANSYGSEYLELYKRIGLLSQDILPVPMLWEAGRSSIRFLESTLKDNAGRLAI